VQYFILRSGFTSFHEYLSSNHRDAYQLAVVQKHFVSNVSEAAYLATHGGADDPKRRRPRLRHFVNGYFMAQAKAVLHTSLMAAAANDPLALLEFSTENVRKSHCSSVCVLWCLFYLSFSFVIVAFVYPTIHSHRVCMCLYVYMCPCVCV